MATGSKTPSSRTPAGKAPERQSVRQQARIRAEQRQRRRALIQALHEERIEDPLEVSAADAAEERAVAILRRMIPDVGAEEEAFERRFHRLLAAFRPPGPIDEAFPDEELDRGLAILEEALGG